MCSPRRWLSLLFLGIGLIFVLPPVQAQDQIRDDKQTKLSPQQKKAEKMKAAKEKQAKKAYAKEVKARYKDQSKTTKKMMKESRKKSKQLRDNKPPPFWKKWFRKHK